MKENREIFIAEINKMIDQLSPQAKAYFDYIQSPAFIQKESKSTLTDNGRYILTYMISAKKQYNNIFKSKDIAENFFTSTKSISASMQKLVKEGFCTRIGGTPVCYSITEKGEHWKDYC